MLASRVVEARDGAAIDEELVELLGQLAAVRRPGVGVVGVRLANGDGAGLTGSKRDCASAASSRLFTGLMAMGTITCRPISTILPFTAPALAAK